MHTTTCEGITTIETEDWRAKTQEQLEEAADNLLAEISDGPRVYTEHALARKIRLEHERIATEETDELETPVVALDYLLVKQVRLMIESAKLTKLQAAVLSLILYGWDPADVAERFGISYDRALRLLRIAMMRVERGGSPYDGLYEVYWSEVHRYVYRGK